MRRVNVKGTSGSGKSTFAKELARRLEVPYVELDALHHGPNWSEPSAEEFRARVSAALEAAPDGWVIDGNYGAVRPLVWERADTVVWLDPPRRTVMRRVLWRTVRRGVTREPLWNDNRESLRNLFSRDPSANIALWAWRNHAKYRDRYAAAAADPANERLSFVRVASGADAQRLLDSASPLK